MWRHELRCQFALRHPFSAAFAVVYAVVMAPTERIFTHRTPGVIGYTINVRWEKALIGFVNARGDVRPPEKCLHKGRAVVGAHLEFQIGTSRMQADPVHAFHARHWIMITAPDGLRAICVFFDFEIYRQERCGPMMLRPV